MPVKQISTETGHSLAPEGPHTITFHIPGWDSVKSFRVGDPAVLSRMRSIYPRFAPFFEARQLSTLLSQSLSLPTTHSLLPFTSPAAFPLAQEYAFSSHRKEEHRLAEEDLSFRIVDIGAVRLYLVIYPVAKTPGIMGIWQNAGLGVSTRLSEELLKHVKEGGEVKVVEWEGKGRGSVEGMPEGRYLEEEEAHGELRRTVVGLVNRDRAGWLGKEGGGNEDVKEGDVFLCATGMAAVWRVYRDLVNVRKGSAVALGSIFHNSWHLLEETESGFKHFGDVREGGAGMGDFEAYLRAEKEGGGQVNFVFLEFPSNPLLESADLVKLRELADEYGFVLVVDDTVGSFCNVDVLPVADVVISSLTKSFSGYANVMAGSIILNPSSPHYSLLSQTLLATHHNTLFTSDATVLLSNSKDYLPRSAILNRNALTLATFIHNNSRPFRPSSPITRVLYPPFTTTLANCKRFMRPATAGFTPGYGCLLSIDFVSEKAARAFYEAVQFHKGPHLGAHETLAINFNECVWGDNPELAAYQASFGANMEQVRMSVGLEDEAVLVDTVKAALEAAEGVKA